MPLTKNAAGTSTVQRRSVPTAPRRPGDADSGGASARESEEARRRARSVAKQQQAAERIAAATGELSAQTAQANEASRQLREAMQQIAAGAQESSSACQESLAAVNQSVHRIRVAQSGSLRVKEITATLQQLLVETSDGIEALVANVGQSSERQASSVKMISELEAQAEEIGQIVAAVARIADQTNLLALNAAIEAARARQHGKGFAVVADEVRTLAETSERSASQIRELIDAIRVGVTAVAESVQHSADAALGEVEKGKEVNAQLTRIRDEMAEILDGANEIAAAAGQAEHAAQDTQTRAEEIAAAAEEQSAAVEESLQTVEQQGVALRQSERAAEELAAVADELRSSTDIGKSAEEVASTSEELSSAIEEINRAATQIAAAIEQISTGAQTQATKSNEAVVAVAQIEQGAQVAENRAAAAMERADDMIKALGANKETVDGMIVAIADSAATSRESVKQVVELEIVSRKIDKIVDAIGNVAIQTNMLAVNGSVESARAGEYGKGFAVVSTDIRNLARDSADNAERIKDLVKEVQDRILVVRTDLEETSRLTLAEAERARASTTRLLEVERSMGEVRAGNEEVRDAAQEVATAVVQVKTGLDQISVAAKEADSTVGEASAAAQQQSAGAEEIAAAIEEIAALADELRSA